MKRDEIFAAVTQILADVLIVDAEDIEANTLLCSELLAVPSDFANIAARLESHFSFTIPKGELFPEPFKKHVEYYKKLTADFVAEYVSNKLRHAGVPVSS